MTDPIELGFVAAGKRAQTLMSHLYDLRDREYFACDRDDGYPQSIYRMFGAEDPDWLEDVSDLHPTVTAVMSPSRESRESASSLCRDRGDDPELFSAFEEFLEAGEFDVALVCSPQDAHADAVVPLLEGDRDVFCEKPLAHTLADHDRIIAAEERSAGMLYVGFQRRVSPLFRRVKELIDAGAIGDLGMISHVEVRDPFHVAHPGEKGYRYSQDRSGGALLEKNVHHFDVFNWYSGADPEAVSAIGGQHVLERNTDVIDQAILNIQYEGGIVASLELCLYNGAGERDIYDVRVRTTSEYRGSDGLLTVPDDPGVIEVDTREKYERIEIGPREAGGHSGDLYEMHHLLRCVQGQADPPASATDAKKAAAVAIAGETSIRNDGTRVEITEDYELRP